MAGLVGEAVGVAGLTLLRVFVVAWICLVADSRLAIWVVIILEALKRFPFLVYSLKTASRSRRRVCSALSFIRVEARTIRSLAARIANSGVLYLIWESWRSWGSWGS